MRIPSMLCISLWIGVAAPLPDTRSAWLSGLPLRFEQDTSATATAAAYIARSQNFEVRLAPTEIQLRGRMGPIALKLAGANPRVRMDPEQPSGGQVNYLIGPRSAWKTGVPGYDRVRYREIYPGVDMVFYGSRGRIEFDFIVSPHADPARIQINFRGQESLHIDPAGDLVMSSGGEETIWHVPEIYQTDGRRKRVVNGGFALRGENVVFTIGGYDSSRPLVIDPTLSYSTYLGGSGNDRARGIGIDGAGNVYIAGSTTSMNLQTVSALQPNFAGLGAANLGGDAFVAKFSPSGALLYLTYLGGSGDDAATSLAVDAAGDAFVTGSTDSQDFPTTSGAYQTRFGGFGGNVEARTGDAFVAKLNPSGNKLIYSTYLGGSFDDVGMAIAVDAAGVAYIAGATRSTNFPTTPGAYQIGLRGGGGEPIRPCCGLPFWDPGDAFVVKLSADGRQLIFSTLLGGGDDDTALAVAVDSAGNVYIAGFTISANFPTTPGALQRSWGGTEQQNAFFTTGDGFIAKFDPTGTSLLYSTYFGGAGDDCVTAISVDATGAVYMTGFSSTRNLPVSSNAFQKAYAGYFSLPFSPEELFGDAFVGKLNPNGGSLAWLTYLGGSANDGGTAIAVDAQGNVFVAGFTNSTNFPLAGNPVQSTMAGTGSVGQDNFLFGDAFLAELNPTGTSLLYATYFGGNLDEGATGLALDQGGNAYITGTTVSDNLKTTANAAQPKFGGAAPVGTSILGDAFYAVFTGFPNPPVINLVANAEGEGATIAPNTWVEIKGTGLATDSRIWQSADFAPSNLMPTSLDGTSVTMNGKNAYVYYISSTQLNVLAPPDLAPGSVQVVVTINGISSPPYTVQAQQYSESFFVFNGGPYVIATHLDGSLIGPASLYPGSTTPAKPGETIIIYANGFGPTSVAVSAGAPSQSGTLVNPPVIRVGGLNANVGFAGLISPGLYQFNVVIPAGTFDGDNTISAAYAGSSTQAGTLITVQH